LKRVVALLALGALAPMIQGAVGTFVPLQYCPDLGLLLVVGLGLCWRSTAGGIALSAALGLIADLLSGSLFGQHMLLRIFSFGAARACSQQLNLRGVMPRVTFVIALTVVTALGTGALTSFFGAGRGVDGEMLRKLIPHALINGAFAPLGVWLVERISNWLSEVDAGHQILQLRPRNRLT
jgi:cell shape-determining protein MreD